MQDVLIIGGGVSGTALLFELAKYTNLQHITLLEKYDGLAQVNSHGKNNSQTLHVGDIETNYTLEKAVSVKKAAEMIVHYCNHIESSDEIVYKFPKMVLGVGKEECDKLRERFEVFQPHFPHMELWEKDKIAEIEPRVAEGRSEEIVALGSVDQVAAVDYNALSHSFVEEAMKCEKDVDIQLGCKVLNIDEKDGYFHVETNKSDYQAKFVVVSAGGHSLLFAQQMGYGLEFSCLPMAGSFYYAPQCLNGKVYTVQNDALPFAALHGDPDVVMEGKTRFGPTALMLPVLERYNLKTFPEFLKVLKLDGSVVKVFKDLFKVKDIRDYIFRNFLFEVPFVRRRLFLKDIRKIVPTLQLEDLKFAKNIGGIRPQLIDKKNKSLLLGEAKINPGNGLIFNMTPSPGGTSCLDNARKDLRTIVDFLECEFDEKQFNLDLYGVEDPQIKD